MLVTQEMSASSSPFCPDFCSRCWCLIFSWRSSADKPVRECELWVPGHTELITAESYRLRNKNKSEHKFIVSPANPVDPADPDWKLLGIPAGHAMQDNVDLNPVVGGIFVHFYILLNGKQTSNWNFLKTRMKVLILCYWVVGVNHRRWYWWW